MFSFDLSRCIFFVFQHFFYECIYNLSNSMMIVNCKVKNFLHFYFVFSIRRWCKAETTFRLFNRRSHQLNRFFFEKVSNLIIINLIYYTAVYFIVFSFQSEHFLIYIVPATIQLFPKSIYEMLNSVHWFAHKQEWQTRSPSIYLTGPGRVSLSVPVSAYHKRLNKFWFNCLAHPIQLILFTAFHQILLDLLYF